MNYLIKRQELKKEKKMQQNKLKLFTITLFCIGLTGLQAQTVTDNDGNVYPTITIGAQVWMAENLKTTKYNDGRAVPLVTDDKAWKALTTPAYCWYNNNAKNNKDKYGALYNWYTVKTNKLCPTGWHVPTDAEWTVLTTYLGGEGVAGGKLKEVGTKHWHSPNSDATNSSGFTALPSGVHNSDGTFGNIGDYGFWWSSIESNTFNAWYWLMYFFTSDTHRESHSKRDGYSVRCIKNN
jgi:uncharacterized protein (TIGR02145 family)